MRLLTFVLNALWDEVCRIESGRSLHRFDPEYVKVFFKKFRFSCLWDFKYFNYNISKRGWISIGQVLYFIFVNLQVLHSLDILKQDVIYGVHKFNSRPVDKYSPCSQVIRTQYIGKQCSCNSNSHTIAAMTVSN